MSTPIRDLLLAVALVAAVMATALWMPPAPVVPSVSMIQPELLCCRIAAPSSITASA